MSVKGKAYHGYISVTKCKHFSSWLHTLFSSKEVDIAAKQNNGDLMFVIQLGHFYRTLHHD